MIGWFFESNFRLPPVFLSLLNRFLVLEGPCSHYYSQGVGGKQYWKVTSKTNFAGFAQLPTHPPQPACCQAMMLL